MSAQPRCDSCRCFVCVGERWCRNCRPPRGCQVWVSGPYGLEPPHCAPFNGVCCMDEQDEGGEA